MDKEADKVWQLRLITPVKERIIWEINSLGADIYAASLWQKGVSLVLKVLNVNPAQANIIKQEALASGIDAAVHKNTITAKELSSTLLIIGSDRGVRILAKRLARQGFQLQALSCAIDNILNSRGSYVLKMRDKTLELLTPYVMGILNTTPDSFSDGGMYGTREKVQDRIKQIFDEGALFVDVGGVSTRPGHSPVGTDEELFRIEHAVESAVEIAACYGGFVSVDTMNPTVAEKSLSLGADIINDQSALASIALAKLCAENRAGVCLMYNSQAKVNDIFLELDKTKEQCLKNVQRALEFGIAKESILIDPGFGFGKTHSSAYCILKYLEEFCNLGYPVLIGISRKSMLGRAAGREVDKRSFATVSAETIALMKGAKILRTHNVSACVDAVKIVSNAI